MGATSYDVFLSFRGEDTRYSFVGNLYNALRQRGLKPFMDGEGLKRGDQISLSLLKAIEESRMSIIVFSKNYASSSWCLNELVKILETRKMQNHPVLPIFYQVDPSDVRHQRKSYGKAMAAHENRFRNDLEKVKRWRSALSEVASLTGLHFKSGYEYEFIQMIVEKASAVLCYGQPDRHLIGFQPRMEDVMSLLDEDIHHSYHGFQSSTMDGTCYDVFLSFRGEDTRYSFVGNLYDALRQQGLKPFMENEGLKRGDQISPSLHKVIEESRISIIVLSENYAHSSWCLDELVKILETRKMRSHLVWPIFYQVNPSDVRHQRGSYDIAMAKHEIRFGNDLEKVNRWRSALSEVASLKGWDFKSGYEYEFIQRIVEKATDVLCYEQPDKHLIGLQSRIEDVMSLLDIKSSDTVCMVGIHGTGGIGKTTLAKAIYNLISCQFDCPIFLDSVGERSNGYMGLVHLQEALLCKLFESEKIKLGSVDEGATKLKDRLHQRRVLLVLDDVDDEVQLKKLAGECSWFGSGSRIIITTRYEHLLNVHRVEKRYEMKELNHHEALQLFCWNAFKMSQPEPDFVDVSNRAAHYANGLPLALKVIGSNLVGKSFREIVSALKQYERIQDKEILGILKISYDFLEDGAKNIFLDIACFFKGKSLEYVEKVLDQSHFFTASNIEELVHRALLTIEDGHLRMHDLIQDMAKEVVRLEAIIPGNRSRLWSHEDILNVLRENSGSSNIQGIILDPPELEEVKWSGSALEKMNNLRILIIRNSRFSSGPNCLPNSLRLLDWEDYPSESLPNIPWNAVVLSLPDSHVRLEKSLLKPEHLTDLNFSDCQFLTHIPDVSGVPNLRNLRLDGCINLIEVHHSVGFLEHLGFLSASHCIKLRDFLPRVRLPSLKYFDLHLTRIEYFPLIVGLMDKLVYISLEHTHIKELPYSIGNLMGLECLQMQYSVSLRDLPSNLFMLPKIEELWLHGSPQVLESFRRFQVSHVVVGTGQPGLRRLYFSSGGLTVEDFDVILSCFPNLEELHVPYNCFVSLQASIKEPAKLKVVNVSRCKKLQEIPEEPLRKKVKATHCPLLISETSRKLLSQLLSTIGPDSRTLSMNYCHSDGESLTSCSEADCGHHKWGEISSTSTIKEKQMQRYQAF